MATDKQIHANRRNAQKSTGPRTARGKAASRWNALKSGIDAQLEILPGEDPQAHATLVQSFRDAHQPADPAERDLVDALANASGSSAASAVSLPFHCNEGAMRLDNELEVPDGAVDKCAEAELIRSVKEQTALKLYSDERVTTGEAAEMLGLTRIQFLDLLRGSGVGFRVELDDQDFAQIRRWREDHARLNSR